MIINNKFSMEFRNVVFNAARDGKLRRLKVSSFLCLKFTVVVIFFVSFGMRREKEKANEQPILSSNTRDTYCIYVQIHSGLRLIRPRLSQPGALTGLYG